MNIRYLFVLSCLVLLLLVGCAAQHGPGWGEDATIAPGWARVGTAAKEAALSPATWLPLAGAGLLQIDNADHRISHWASKETPVFGSQHSAATASDALLWASVGLYAATVFATPSSGDHWIEDKAKGISVGVGAELATAGLTEGIRLASGRKRPNGSGLSFPSGHASGVAVSASLAADNVDYLDVPDADRYALYGLAGGLDIGTAWARVEAHKHFPSDVLVGTALGHFIGAFADRAFLDPYGTRIHLVTGMSRQGFFIGFADAF